MTNSVEQNTHRGSGRPSPATGSFGGEDRGTRTVSAIYPSEAEAGEIRQRLLQRGFAGGAVEIRREVPSGSFDDGKGEHASDEVLTNMMVDGIIGTAVGTGVGAVGTAILWAANISLFVASPVVAPVVMLGWFASVGGLLGAAAGTGARHKRGKFSAWVRNAIQRGNRILIARTHDETERALAREIIGHSLSGRDQVAAESV